MNECSTDEGAVSAGYGEGAVSAGSSEGGAASAGSGEVATSTGSGEGTASEALMRVQRVPRMQAAVRVLQVHTALRVQ